MTELAVDLVDELARAERGEPPRDPADEKEETFTSGGVKVSDSAPEPAPAADANSTAPAPVPAAFGDDGDDDA